MRNSTLTPILKASSETATRMAGGYCEINFSLIYIISSALATANLSPRKKWLVNTGRLIHLMPFCLCGVSSVAFSPWPSNPSGSRVKAELAKGNGPPPSHWPPSAACKGKHRSFSNKSLQRRAQWDERGRLNGTVYCWENVHFSVPGWKRNR